MGFCENTHGSYQCACPPGYKLGSDGRSCQDIDECETENVCRGRNEICTNIKGSHRCTRKNCPADYINDPEYKKYIIFGAFIFIDIQYIINAYIFLVDANEFR